MNNSGSGDCLLTAINSAIGPPRRVSKDMMNSYRVSMNMPAINGFWSVSDIRWLTRTHQIPFFLRRVYINSSNEFRSIHNGIYLLLASCKKAGQICGHAFVVDCNRNLVLDGFHKPIFKISQRWEVSIQLLDIHKCFKLYKFT
jgi:hypothetical protein